MERDHTNELHCVRNVPLGIDEQIARDEHDALVRAAACCRRQLPGGFVNIDADDGEIAGGEFPNVRAVLQGDGLCAVGVRIGADSAAEFNVRVHNETTFGQTAKKCKHKIQCICCSPYMRFRVSL